MIGDVRIHLETVDSTNRYARELVSTLPEEGTVVTADLQTAGRGRMERQWLSAPAQNILASIILYPTREAEEWGGLPVLAGLAVHNTVRKLSTVETHLKWPNDVLVDTRKLCGILVETGRFGEKAWAVLGIGINVNQVEFNGEYRLTPTSLALEAGRTFDTEEVLAALCRELAALYSHWSEKGSALIFEQWRKATRILGNMIEIEENGVRVSRRAIDISEDGSLITMLPDGRIEHVFAGDVSLREENHQ